MALWMSKSSVPTIPALSFASCVIFIPFPDQQVLLVGVSSIIHVQLWEQNDAQTEVRVASKGMSYF